MAVVVASEVIDFKWRERTNKVASWDRIFRIAQTTTIIVIFLVWLIGQATFDEKSCSRLSRNVEKYFKISLIHLVTLVCLTLFCSVLECFAANMLVYATSPTSNADVQNALFWSRFWFHLNLIVVLFGVTYIFLMITYFGGSPFLYIAVSVGLVIRTYMLYLVHWFIRDVKDAKNIFEKGLSTTIAELL